MIPLSFDEQKELLAERDDARKWARRMKRAADHYEGMYQMWHRSYCEMLQSRNAFRAENARLRRELEIIRGENMSDLSRRIATIVISGVQPSHAPPEDGED